MTGGGVTHALAGAALHWHQMTNPMHALWNFTRGPGATLTSRDHPAHVLVLGSRPGPSSSSRGLVSPSPLTSLCATSLALCAKQGCGFQLGGLALLALFKINTPHKLGWIQYHLDRVAHCCLHTTTQETETDLGAEPHLALGTEPDNGHKSCSQQHNYNNNPRPSEGGRGDGCYSRGVC